MGRIRYLQEDGSGTTKADLQVFGWTLPTKDPNSDDCLQCGEEQQVGTLIMAGMGMMGTFGAFFLSLLYLCFDSNAATRLDAYSYRLIILVVPCECDYCDLSESAGTTTSPSNVEMIWNDMKRHEMKCWPKPSPNMSCGIVGLQGFRQLTLANLWSNELFCGSCQEDAVGSNL